MNMRHVMRKVFMLVSVEFMTSCSLIDLWRRFRRICCVHQHAYEDGGQYDLQKCGYISTRLHGVTCHGTVNLMYKFTFQADLVLGSVIHHHHYHHHISVMELGHLLTSSGLPYPEFSSKVCQLGNSVSLP